MAMSKCSACSDGVSKPMPFSMAFQPIVNVETGNVYAYEALVRGPNDEGAATILSQLTEANRYSFDQSCRVEAIKLASRLGLVETGAALSINFLPNAVQSPSACIQLTLRTAREFNFPLDRLIFEVSECEQVRDPKHLRAIVREYHRHGFQIAIDDFGAGFANLTLLAELECSIVKLDMALIHNLHRRPRSETIVRSSIRLLQELGATVIAEGIETIQEYQLLRDCGIQLMQGYLLARPAFEALPPVTIPVTSTSRMQPKREPAAGFPMFPALAFAARA
jgi:EAL domain-containing protein (putative c-di-GMP-specific phosphodiesterase class I)